MAVYITSPAAVWALRPRGKPPPCSLELRERLVSLELWNPTRLIRTTSGWRPVPRRGCRAGRRVYQQQVTSSAAVPQPQVSVSVSTSPSHRVPFACLNVRSQNNKLDDVLEIVRDRRIDIFCASESWHDVCDQRVSMSSTDRVHVLQMICWSTTAASLFSRRRISP